MGSEAEFVEAIRLQDTNVVQRLIRDGMQLNVVIRDHIPITLAACIGSDKIVELLISLGCNVNESIEVGRTALHYAATNGETKVIRILLDHGAEIEARDEEGETPLMYAAFHEQVNACKLLIQRGADVNARRAAGSSVLGVAALSTNKRATKIVQLLVAAGADMNQSPVPAVLTACAHASVEAVEVMLRAGADVNARDGHEWTPLMAAALRNRRDVVKLLLRHGADPSIKLPAEARNYPDCTANEIAVGCGHGPIVDSAAD